MVEGKVYNISISAKAAERIKQQLIKRNTPESSLRLGVKGGGCSGYSYALQFEDLPARPNKDLTFESQGINIIIDIKSIIYLNGSMLDWETTLINNGYKFVNPNEKGKCGCKLSFNV